MAGFERNHLRVERDVRGFARLMIAGIAATLPFLALAAWGQYDYYFGELTFLPDGAPDNAVIRSSGAVLILSPIFTVIFAVYFGVSDFLLRRFSNATFAAHSTIGGAISIALGMLTKTDRPDLWQALGERLASAAFLFLCFALGAAVLCAATRRRNRGN